MTEDPNSALSAGELRRLLEEAGASWSLDRDLDDDARPPAFPLGGEVPPDAPDAEDVERIDFRALLSENPPADPELAQACVEAGLLDPDLAQSVERSRPGQERAPVEQPRSDAEAPPGPEVEPDDVAPPVFRERGGGGEAE
jgi:hypothetical protein